MKTLKILVCLCFCTILIGSSFTRVESSQKEEKHALAEVTFTYRKKDKTMFISGKGNLSYYERSVPSQLSNIKDYHEADRIVLEEGITGVEGGWIGHYFQGIRKIELPESLTHIGNYAFHECDVEKIVLPQTLTKIPEGCFSYCVYLEEIQMPESVKVIEEGAFFGCHNLKKVNMPSGVTQIGEDAFYKCEKLEEFVIPENLTKWVNPIKKCYALKKITNLSSFDCQLNDYNGKKTWKVDGKKATHVASGKTAKGIGKKYKIRYRFFGGKETKKMPRYYRFGTSIKLPTTVKKKGYTLLGWRLRGCACGKEISACRVGDITISARWVKYKVKNVKNRRIKVILDDSDSFQPQQYYYLRYSENKDMFNSKYIRLAQWKGPRYIKNLKKNKTYYVQVAWFHHEADQPEEGQSYYNSLRWLGKRKIKIRK